MICGGAIGIEREIESQACRFAHQRPDLFWRRPLHDRLTSHQRRRSVHMTRLVLPLQVVAGIGFLGAGVILQARGSDHRTHYGGNHICGWSGGHQYRRRTLLPRALLNSLNNSCPRSFTKS